jgi:GNAT superfamily N-acetyltransferase
VSPDDVQIRPAREEDADAFLAGYEWLFAPPGSRPPDWDPAAAGARLRATIAGPESVALLAEREGRVVGICTAYIDLLSVRFGRRCWVEDLAVDPAERSRGVGARLLARAREWAARHGASHLELDSGEARTDAHRFYEREGAHGRSLSFGWHGLGGDG